MPNDSETQTTRTQKRYARLSGFLLLWLIINALAGTLLFSRVVGSGASLADTAARVAASERLYRVALASQVLETLSAILLAFALYVTLKSVNTFRAQLAMIFVLEDSVLAWIGRMSSFA